MTPESMYETLVEQLPGPWQPHEHGALIVLGEGLTFVVAIEPNSTSWTVASTEAVGYGSWRWVKGIKEIPGALGWLVTSFMVGGDRSIDHLPEWLHPTIQRETAKSIKRIESELERARELQRRVNIDLTSGNPT